MIEPAAADPIPLTISWNLTRRCNLSCAHCYLDARHETDPRELTPGQALAVLDQIARVNPQAFLILTGGEPMLRADLPDLVRAATDRGFWTVLGSHGGLLDAPSIARLAAAGLKGAGVSLDSIDPARHDRFRGLAGSWRRTVASLGAMREAGLPFLIEMTVTRETCGEIAALADLALAEGATSLNVFFLVPAGRGAKLNDLDAKTTETTLVELARLQERHAGKLLLHAKCAPHYRRILWEIDAHSPFVRTFRGGGCPAGTLYCRIGPHGEVTPCPYMSLEAGNVLETPFAEIWATSPLLHRMREEPRGGRCGRCEFSELCGGCRCRALAATGDPLSEDPSCSYEPGGYGGDPIRLEQDSTYGAPAAPALEWTPRASARLEKIPQFARGMVVRAVEKVARERGLTRIDDPLLDELRQRMAGRFPMRRPRP